MAFPSSGIESVWRNSINEVASLLHKYHGGKFKILNLSERRYDYGKFDNRVLDFGFPDHHSPPLELLFRIISSIHEFLSENESNVAVVHCTGGKGRTGTVIACYMVYCGLFETTDEALNYFAEKRSKREKGVTQPSQRRYFNDVVSHQVEAYSQKRLLKRIILKPVPRFNRKLTGSRPVISIYSTASYPKKLLYKSWKGEELPKAYKSGTDQQVVIEVNCLIEADIMIKLSNVSKTALRKRPEKKCRFSFHTGFLPSEGSQELRVIELDDYGHRKKFLEWFDAAFAVRIEFDIVEESSTANETFQTLMSNREIRTKTVAFPTSIPLASQDDDERRKFYKNFFNKAKTKKDLNPPRYSVGLGQLKLALEEEPKNVETPELLANIEKKAQTPEQKPVSKTDVLFHKERLRSISYDDFRNIRWTRIQPSEQHSPEINRRRNEFKGFNEQNRLIRARSAGFEAKVTRSVSLIENREDSEAKSSEEVVDAKTLLYPRKDSTGFRQIIVEDPVAEAVVIEIPEGKKEDSTSSKQGQIFDNQSDSEYEPVTEDCEDDSDEDSSIYERVEMKEIVVAVSHGEKMKTPVMVVKPRLPSLLMLSEEIETALHKESRNEE